MSDGATKDATAAAAAGTHGRVMTPNGAAGRPAGRPLLCVPMHNAISHIVVAGAAKSIDAAPSRVDDCCSSKQ